MAYLKEVSSVEPSAIPDPPSGPVDWFSTICVPPWVMPMAFAIANGQDQERAINGIGFDKEGDLLLYRRFTTDDWERYPQLIGVKEAWIVFALEGVE
jgi:hypothetical protein